MRSFPFLILIGVAACGSKTPANVAGAYTIAVTNHDNGCNLANWTVGGMQSGIPATITQDGSDATASVTGFTGGYLDLALGDHNFTGTVDGDVLDLTLFGTRSQTSGNCTYTYNAVLGATLTNDALEGTIDYESKTNGNPDCSSMGITGCKSEQAFNGTRPPST